MGLYTALAALPGCGEDELYSLELPEATTRTIAGCYHCGWKPPAPRTGLAADDTFSRKAQTVLPGGEVVEREWRTSERYHLYARGFRDGAATKAIRADHEGLGPYDRGYADGRAATQAACAAEAKRVGYEPSILRAAEG